MAAKRYRITKVVKLSGIGEESIFRYEEEGLISPLMDEKERLYTDEDVEKIKMIKRLIDDLGVNLPGVEVILNMREHMISMQDEFEQIINEMKSGIQRELRSYESRFSRPMLESKAGKKIKVRIED